MLVPYVRAILSDCYTRSIGTSFDDANMYSFIAIGLLPSPYKGWNQRRGRGRGRVHRLDRSRDRNRGCD